MKKILFALLFILSFPLAAQTTIAPNNSAILYSPYNWYVTSSAAKTINMGAYFRTIFSGTSISISFNTSTDVSPYPELWARIDGTVWQEYILTAGNPTWALATGLVSRKHLVEFIVKSTTQVPTGWIGPDILVSITGITLDSGAAVYAPLRRTKNILMYGDSITAGIRTVNCTAANDTDQNDALAVYSYALGTAMDAEIGVVAFGGTGILSTGVGGYALPASYTFIYPGQARTFSPVPDLVIYNEGTNDTSSLSPPTAFLTGYETVMAGIVTAAPSAKQLLLIPFNLESSFSTLIPTAVAAMSNANITSVSTTGWFNAADSCDGLHPYGYEHLDYIAPRLFPVVTGLLYSGTGQTAVVY